MKNYSILLLIFCCLMGSCGNSSTKEKSPADNGVVSGAQIYSDNCVICHGADGKAKMAGASDLSTSVLTHEQAVEVLTNGRNTMRSFSSQLSKEEIDAVVKHVETLR